MTVLLSTCNSFNLPEPGLLSEKASPKAQGYDAAMQQFAEGARAAPSKDLSIHTISSMGQPQKGSSLCCRIVGCARWLLVKGGGSLNAETEKNLNIIAELTGSNHLSLVINEAEPVITNLILDAVTRYFEDNKTLWNWLYRAVFGKMKNNPTMFCSIVKFMMSKIYLNMANAKGRLVKRGDTPRTFTFVDAVACLVEVFNANLPKIHSRIKSIEANPDPGKRKRELHNLFAPLSDELLDIILPEGEKEFPLKWQSKYAICYTSFKDQMMPEILLSLYKQLSIPSTEEDKQKLLRLNGGEDLVSLAQGAAQKVEELIPSFLSMPMPSNGVVDVRRKSFQKALGPFGLAGTPQQMQDYFVDWMMRQCVAFGKNGTQEIKLLWKFLGSYTEPILLHIFSSLAAIPLADLKAGFVSPDALSSMMIKSSAVISNFFNANAKSIDVRILELKRYGYSIESDSVLLSKFKPLADEMLTMTGMVGRNSLPIPEAFKDLVLSNLRNLAPKFLLRQYIAIANFSMDDRACRDRLRVQLFDPKNLKVPTIASEVISHLYQNKSIKPENMSDAFYQELWAKTGTEAFVQNIEGMCGAFSRNIIAGLMKRFGLSQQKMLSVDTNAFMKSAVDFAASFVEVNLLRLLTQIIEATPIDDLHQSEKHPKLYLAFHVFKRYSDIFGRDLKNMEGRLKEIATEYAKDPEQRDYELRKAFSTLANDLHSSVGPNPLSNIPFDAFVDSDSFRDMIWKTIRSDILPSVLQANYSEIMTWRKQMQQSLDSLQVCYHSTHPEWACRVLAQYVSDFIRHYLTVSHKEVAKMISAALQDYFREAKDSKGNSIADAIRSRPDLVEQILSGNIRHVGKSNDQEILQIWPFLTEYMEAVLVKCFNQISLLIQDIEADHPDFMVDIAINILKETLEYFTVLNEQTKKHSEEHAYNIIPALLLASFGTKLHNGVPLDPSAPEHSKDRTRLEGWLVPMAYKLMRLTGLTADDFPMPASIRRPLGELIVKVLLPRILLAIDKQILEPRFRDMLMLESVQMLHAALNDINPSARDEVSDGDNLKTDPKRNNLNALCGDIVHQLFKLIPDGMVEHVFMKEKVRNMSAEVIGNAIMAYLSKRTLLQLIDTVVFKALPSLHPSRWEGKAFKEVLVPKIKIEPRKGKITLKTIEKFKFTFPESPREVRKERERKGIEAKQIQHRLRDGFSQIISSQVFAKTWSYIKALWSHYIDQLGNSIARYFPEYGPRVKAALEVVFHRIFIDLKVAAILISLCQPIVDLCKFLVEKLKIDTKSDEIIETLHLDAVEHLLNKSIDIVIDKLDELQKDVRERRSSTQI